MKPLKINACMVISRSLLLSGLLITQWQSSVAFAETAPFLRDGKAGFVISSITYALAPDAKDTGACPSGMSINTQDIFASTAEGKRRAGESDESYAKRLFQGAREFSTAPNGQNLCEHPEAGKPDPHYKTVQVNDLHVDGLNLDGIDSKVGKAQSAGTCPHNDFPGLDGREGVDNQFYRVVGCHKAYQSNGQANSFAIEMLTGAWGMLINLSGVDNLTNDDHVEVGIYANADPIRLSPNREPLSYATYAMDQDERFRATTTGRIENGVLITEPVDVRFRHVTNSMRLERPLRDARLQLTISEAGQLSGFLGGFAPVEEMYDYQFGFRNGKDAAGKLSYLRSGSANGAAFVLGHTCQGVYFALYEHADGHPDPVTGKCTSISTQYRIEAKPAFVVDVDTKSVNAKLGQNE